MSLDYPCIFYEKGRCTKYDVDGVVSWCVLEPCTDQKRSNADRVRQMSDEDLKKLFMQIGGAHCPPDYDEKCTLDCGKGYCWANWLEKEEPD